MAAVHPQLLATEEMAGDVETIGELTVGATVFDRRRVPAWRRNMAVGVDLRCAEVIEQIVGGLNQAAERAG